MAADGAPDIGVQTPEDGDAAELSPLTRLLRCVHCGGELVVSSLRAGAIAPQLGPDGHLRCTDCGLVYPIIAGTPRMLRRAALGRLHDDYPGAHAWLSELGIAPGFEPNSSQARTAASFAYEWKHFGALRPEWKKNFLDYLRPHRPADLGGKLLLDVGTGSGRHALHASLAGASVVAVDVGPSIDIARANLPRSVLTVQADAEQLPLPPACFDVVMSIGVLHHLPDPVRGLRAIARHARPGGYVHVYLYWRPERRSHRAVLRAVSAVRIVTTRIPFRILHAACYPLAALLHIVVVAPYRQLRRRPRGHRLAEALPLKTYADYPFSVLVNDQFDRLSAPLERRFSRNEVEELLESAGLEQIQLVPNSGWIGDGRVPAR